MDEHLVGYLLNGLDPVTHRRVENHLRTHPEARAKLELLRQALAPLAEAADPEPPPGLAVATLARVAEYRCALPAAPAAPSEADAPGWRWPRRADWVVAACLLLLVGGLALPAVAKQWQRAQRVACADNLRRFHGGLTAYAEANGGDFPRVEANGPRSYAGFFVPALTDLGVAQDVSVGCPAHGRRAPPSYTVDELVGLSRNDPDRFESVVAQLAGNYAYCLGYEEQGRLCGLRQSSGDLLPILADCPGPAEQSDNHGSGAGQNVLYVGGNVRWCARPTAGEENDHIFLNQRNYVRAGLRRSDTVLGGSNTRPFVAE